MSSMVRFFGSFPFMEKKTSPQKKKILPDADAESEAEGAFESSMENRVDNLNEVGKKIFRAG